MAPGGGGVSIHADTGLSRGLLRLEFPNWKNTQQDGDWKKQGRVAPIGFFFIHISKRRYDKKNKVYHIAFYHILTFSKSLSYRTLSYFQKYQKVYHIRFIIYQI